MSRYTFTAFASRKIDAKKKQEEACPYYGNHENHSLAETTRAVGEWDKLHGKAQFWSGGEYAEHHSREDWQGSAQVTIGYARECLPYLSDALNDLPWQWSMWTTMQDEGPSVVVRIPLSVRVTNPETYTRIAALLAADIQMIGARDGSDSITYLWQWDINDLQIIDRAEEGTVLEPMSYHAKNKGRMVFFRDWVGLGRKPAGEVKAIRANDTNADGLFSWGGQ